MAGDVRVCKMITVFELEFACSLAIIRTESIVEYRVAVSEASSPNFFSQEGGTYVSRERITGRIRKRYDF